MITSEELGTNKSLLSSTTDLEANQLKNDVYVEFITEQLREEQVRFRFFNFFFFYENLL